MKQHIDICLIINFVKSIRVNSLINLFINSACAFSSGYP